MLVFLLDTSLKITLLILAARILSFLLRRSSSTLKHLLWNVTFAGMFIVMLGFFLPSHWQVELLPDPHASVAVTLPHSVSSVGAPTLDAEYSHQSEPIATWPNLLFAVWLSGFLFLLIRFSYGMFRAQGLIKEASLPSGPYWSALLDGLEREYDLRIRPRVLISPKTITPMTMGAFRPVVLFPCEAWEWEMERIRLVLIHEISHIKRHDFLTLLCSKFLCAVYWFNPFMWMAERHLMREREQASDDLVVNSGNKASTYAEHLLDIARMLRSPEAAYTSLGMAKLSELEGRMVALLNSDARRLGPKAGTVAAVSLLMLLPCLPLAGMTPWTAISDVARGIVPSQSSNKLKLVMDKDRVCMLTDEYLPSRDEPTMDILLNGATYHVATESCKEGLTRHVELRYAVDPYSGEQVDKSQAVIGAYPHTTKVAYFENEANFYAFNALK